MAHWAVATIKIDKAVVIIAFRNQSDIVLSKITDSAQKQVWLTKNASARPTLLKNSREGDYCALRAATSALRASSSAIVSCNALVSGAMNWS